MADGCFFYLQIKGIALLPYFIKISEVSRRISKNPVDNGADIGQECRHFLKNLFEESVKVENRDLPFNGKWPKKCKNIWNHFFPLFWLQQLQKFGGPHQLVFAISPHSTVFWGCNPRRRGRRRRRRSNGRKLLPLFLPPPPPSPLLPLLLRWCLSPSTSKGWGKWNTHPGTFWNILEHCRES